MNEIKVRLLRKGARMPAKATDGSAGYDVYLPEDVTIRERRTKVPLGFALLMPPHLCAKIRARSGQSANGMSGYRTADCNEAGAWRFDADAVVGLVDSDYRSEVHIIIHKRDFCTMHLRAGTRIAQMTFEYVPPTTLVETDEDFPETERGSGAFGHSGMD